MSYTLRMHGVILGRSELEESDEDRGIASGAFRPGLGYELVQPIFELHREATTSAGEVVDPEKLARYEKAAATLGLEVVDASGEVVAAETILLRTTEGRKTPRLEVRIGDPAYWTARRSRTNR
ncbi:MAG TPA: hypothetical protein VMM18_03640 [Gemmatimonadaceae bacterium]|nr:hypothetical protein [Gemmatimonadaceae bacterium]